MTMSHGYARVFLLDAPPPNKNKNSGQLNDSGGTFLVQGFFFSN